MSRKIPANLPLTGSARARSDQSGLKRIRSGEHRSRSGLSFLEILLAVSMLALLLVGASTFLFSFSRTYFTLETAPQFERHADGVVEFLEFLAASSTDPQAPVGKHFAWSVPPGSRNPTLAFQVDRTIPFFVSELQPLPPLRAFLQFDEENNQFWLLWFPDPSITDGEQDIQYTLLSPWARDIEMGFYNESQKNWEFELASSDNRQNANQRPERIRLLFEREGATIARRLDMNPQNRNVLAY